VPHEPPNCIEGDIIDCNQAVTLWGLFCERVRRSRDRIAYRDHDRVSGTWRDHTWGEIAKRVDGLRSALARSGLSTGDRVGLLLPNGVDWICTDLAVLGSGLVVVALYPYDSAANIAYILGHSGARLLLLDTQARWKSLLVHNAEFPTLQQVWFCDNSTRPIEHTVGPIEIRLADVIAHGGPVPATPDTGPTSLATLIYTSGTTARPSGVMLSHFAILWNAEATATVIPPRPSDVFLSILPLAHAFERTLGYYLPMMGGSTVAYARSAENLAEDLLANRPTVLLGVPRLYERIFRTIRAQAAGSVIKFLLLRWTTALGWRRFEASQGRRAKLGLAARLILPLLERRVAVLVQEAFGGRLRIAVSGGAPLDPNVQRALLGLGLPLVEGYGLTEAAPVVAATSPDDNLPGAAGRPLRGISVKLSQQGELLVRSPAVMKRYWRDDAKTAQMLDPNGWLSTGDLAEIREGRIFIRGRLKEMIVLSTGEKLNPNIVEAEIMRDPLVAQVAVVGDGKPFPAALIVLDRQQWARFAQRVGATFDKPNRPVIRTRVLARIDRLLADMPRHTRVRAVHLSFEPWTIEEGLITPTFKVRREALQRRFSAQINELYAGHR